MPNDLASKCLDDIIEDYRSSLEGGVMPERALLEVEQGLRPDTKGYIRKEKGALVERITQNLITAAWLDKNNTLEGLEFKSKKIKIPARSDYFERPEIKKIFETMSEDEILQEKERYVYGLKPDVCVYIQDKFTLSVESKAFTENAMLKRILIDAWLLRQVRPNVSLALLQLENFMGGDYHELDKKIHMGSGSTHALMSYFNDINLQIITLLEGDRHPKKPIHEREHYKPLKKEHLESAMEKIKKLLD